MDQYIRLSTVVNSPEYLGRLGEAAKLSNKKKCETGFITYTDEHFSWVKNNIPIAFESDHVDEAADRREGHGYTVELYSPSIAHTHFHPPKTLALPSFGDLMKLHAVRLENRSLGEMCDSDKYSNPLAVVGLYKDPRTIEVFLFQERNGYLSEEEILKRLSKLYSKKNPDDQIDASMLRVAGAFGFADDIIPRKKDETIKFLESSGIYVAEGFTIRNGRINESDLEKLTKFDEHLFEVVPKEEEDDDWDEYLEFKFPSW